jgi:hypothetical protein
MSRSYSVHIALGSSDAGMLQSEDFPIPIMNPTDFGIKNCYLVNNYGGTFNQFALLAESSSLDYGRKLLPDLNSFLDATGFEYIPTIKEPIKKIYKQGHFEYLDRLLKYANDENLEIISITIAHKFAGYDLVYLEK